MQQTLEGLFSVVSKPILSTKKKHTYVVSFCNICRYLLKMFVRSISRSSHCAWSSGRRVLAAAGAAAGGLCEDRLGRLTSGTYDSRERAGSFFRQPTYPFFIKCLLIFLMDFNHCLKQNSTEYTCIRQLHAIVHNACIMLWNVRRRNNSCFF